MKKFIWLIALKVVAVVAVIGIVVFTMLPASAAELIPSWPTRFWKLNLGWSGNTRASSWGLGGRWPTPTNRPTGKEG